MDRIRRLSAYASFFEALQNKEITEYFMANITLEDIKDVLGDELYQQAVMYLRENQSEDLSGFIKTLEVAQADLLWSHKTQDTVKVYRTKARSGETLDELPDRLAIITNKNYQGGLSLYDQGQGPYLQPLSSADGIRFDSGILYFKGLPASVAQLQHLYTKEGIDSIDLPLLRTFYTIILNEFSKTYLETNQVNEVVRIYLPDLAVYLGKSRNLSKLDREAILNKVSTFHNVMGVIKDPQYPKRSGSLMPVLLFEGYDETTNTLAFSSPYMNWLIKNIYNVSIRKNKKGEAMVKKTGEPQLLASHSYLIKSSIGKERNKKAVEIVSIVVSLIEQTKKGVPHITAGMIVEQNPLLKKSIEEATSTSNQNNILKRAFTKAWELLESQTDLKQKYPNIQLPDSKKKTDIPTMATLDHVIEFPH